MPANPVGEPIEIIVFGAAPHWLSDLAGRQKGISIDHRPGFAADGCKWQPFQCGAFIWIGSDISADARLQLLGFLKIDSPWKFGARTALG